MRCVGLDASVTVTGELVARMSAVRSVQFVPVRLFL